MLNSKRGVKLVALAFALADNGGTKALAIPDVVPDALDTRVGANKPSTRPWETQLRSGQKLRQPLSEPAPYSLPSL